MNRIEQLARKYERYISLPWEIHLAGSERVIFAVYDKSDERRLRAHYDEFAIATKNHGHDWCLVDLTGAFAEWMATERYREAYFESPDALEMALQEFRTAVIDRIAQAFRDAPNAGSTVVAVLGAASLFGLVKVSSVIQGVEPAIEGRLLVFFPGEHEHNNFRLLDARDGWNYRAVPITVDSGDAA